MNISEISKQYKNEKVLKNFSLELEKDKITVLVGPSGCGKTTLLRILSGLEAPDAGTLDNIPKKVSMVFQEHRLLPWATVKDNLLLMYPNALRRDKDSIAKVDTLLAMTGLTNHCKKYPHQLSGGMCKRAALARGFVPDTKLILLDEPLQAVDWVLKLSLVKSFFNIWHKQPVTVVFVTHDIQEAALMGDTIHILNSSPMTLHKTLYNPVKKENRTLYGEKIVEIEREIFKQLTES